MCPQEEGKFSIFSRKKAEKIDESQLKIPTHLAVIMDGNGRWAKKRMLPRSAGHRAGADNLKNLCKNCGHYGIKYVTVYAFSTENWSREAEGIRVRFTGDISALPQNIQEVCKRAEEGSKHRDRMTLIVAFNYGGRREIVQAAQKLSALVASGEIKSEDITEELFSKNLYLPDVPDPDLIIRPSGEERTSNFLVWEGAYSELWFSDVLWPDFGMKELTDALVAYTKRDRRFGGLSQEKKDEK